MTPKDNCSWLEKGELPNLLGLTLTCGPRGRPECGQGSAKDSESVSFAASNEGAWRLTPSSGRTRSLTSTVQEFLRKRGFRGFLGAPLRLWILEEDGRKGDAHNLSK